MTDSDLIHELLPQLLEIGALAHDAREVKTLVEVEAATSTIANLSYEIQRTIWDEYFARNQAALPKPVVAVRRPTLDDVL